MRSRLAIRARTGDARRMERRAFGSLDGGVPVIGLGTWQMERDDRRGAVAALRRGLDLGATHVDTAEMYGDGAVETLVGEAIAGRRDEIVLVTKVLPENASFDGTLRACERSLRRLRTDRIDVYLLHWRGRHPLEETIRAFETLVRDGTIRAWGVSNFAVDDLERALEIAGEGRIACNQVLYHLLERSIEHEVLPWCREHRVAVVGYSPFGSGRFPAARSRGRRVLDEIAATHGTSARAVALRFLVRDPATLTIPKTADESHVEANLAAARLALSSEEIRRIDEAFPLGRRRRGVPTL
jgi:diketogulonate reductase-like aldo/keto reductase